MKIKKIIAILSAVALLGAMTGCGTNKAENNAEMPTETVTATDATTENRADSNDAIVVYFSRAGEQYKVGNIEKGNTAVVAEMIAEKTGADMFGITPAEDNYPMDSYDDLIDYAKQEQNDNARPEINGDVESFEQYSTVFLGYPIWWGTIPRIIYTFMDTYNLSGKTVYMFCTSGSSGISTAVSDVKKYAPEANVIDGMRGTGSTTEAQIKEWLEGNGYNK